MKQRVPALAVLLASTLFLDPARSQDPVSVVSAIGSVASALKSVTELFADGGSGTRDQFADISRAVGQMRQQLNDIERKIDEIKAALASMRVAMAEVAHQEEVVQSQIRVKDEIEAICTDFETYRDWDPAGQRWKLGHEHPAVLDPVQRYRALDDNSRNLRNQGSYASFPVVAMAMAYQRALLPEVGPNGLGDFRKHLGSYVRYYQRAQARSGVEGSVGKRLADAESALRVRADIDRRGGCCCFRADHKDETCVFPNGANSELITFWPVTAVAGDIIHGFTTGPNRFIMLQRTPLKDPRTPAGICPGNPNDRSVWFAKTDVPDPGTTCPDLLNREAGEYSAAADQVRVLNPAMASLKELESVATRWAGGGPPRQRRLSSSPATKR
jgi:hypothetical protein